MIRFRRRRLWIVATAAIAAAIWARIGPLPPDLIGTAEAESIVLVDRSGQPLYEARGSGGSRVARMSGHDVPALLAAATVAAEDRRFYRHPGIDPLAIVRAAARNVRAWRTVEGASTITQQVAKLLLDRAARAPRRRDLRAKLEEAVVALRLEHRLGKAEILALYLNLAPYGNQVLGAARASEIYFGVPPAMLTLAQAAFLAGLPQRPSGYSPYRDPNAARLRQQVILERLGKSGFSAADLSLARDERLQFRRLPADFVAPHFVQMVLASHAGRATRRLETTLDGGLQADVAGIIRSHQLDLRTHGAHNVAVVVLDNVTSEWLAWEGSGDYFDREHGGAIDGVLTPRQPGSALKPFTYALAFDRGVTPATIVADLPASYPTARPGVVYTPRNYDGSFHGPLRVRKALAGSQNVPAVALAATLGVPDLLRLLKTAGFSTFDQNAAYYGLGLTLGNAEVTLAELTAAYAALARGGLWVRPRALRSEPAVPPVRMVSERAAYWVADVLADPEARAYVFGRGGSLELPFAVAVKTGTSQAYRDNWTIGYTRELTVGVWVGNFDRRPLIGSSGVTGAGPIFHAVMLAAHRRLRGHDEAMASIVDRPADLRETAVCDLSGMRVGDACAVRRTEWLPADAAPLPCSWHHLADGKVVTLWPAEYRQWAAREGVLDEEQHDGNASPSPAVLRARHVAPRRFEIANPPAGAVYLIDPTLRAEFQALSMRATGGSGPIEWRVNGRRIGMASADGYVSWPLRAGTHRVIARDRRGRSAEVAILVK